MSEAALPHSEGSDTDDLVFRYGMPMIPIREDGVIKGYRVDAESFEHRSWRTPFGEGDTGINVTPNQAIEDEQSTDHGLEEFMELIERGNRMGVKISPVDKPGSTEQ